MAYSSQLVFLLAEKCSAITWEVKDEISHFEGRIDTVCAMPCNSLAPPNL